MATTLTIQNSINFAAPILKNQPLLVSNTEPAMTAANIVLGLMLGAPLRWRFNRGSFTITLTNGGGTDYVKAISDFGFLETQWIVDAQNSIHQVNGSIALAKDGNSARPTEVAVQYDDNAGNLTFRVNRIPDANYTLNGDYQKKSPLLVSTGQSWGVVPDEFSYIFQWGFLCVMSLLINDSRFPIFENYFISRLLGAQDGLTDQQRNIFVANWMALAQTLTRATGAVNSGVAGRTK